MTSPLETRISDDLRELASGQPFAPDLETIAVRARQRHRRGQALRGAAAAGLAAVTAGGAFVAVHGIGGAAGGPAAPQAETVAYVSQHAETALGNVNNYVEYTRGGQSSSDPANDESYQIWTDPVTLNDYQVNTDPQNGKSLSWGSTYLVNRVLTWKTVEADYSTHTWSTSVIDAGAPLPAGETAASAQSEVDTPQQLESMLNSGRVKMIGRQQVNGQEAVGLSLPLPGNSHRDLWFDAHSFLLLRETTTVGDTTNTRNISWLPRTQSLLNQVNQVHIPAGFTKAAPSR